MRKTREKDQSGTPIDRLEGTIQRFTYRDPDTGFAVVRFAPDGGQRPLSIVGQLAQLAEGQRVTISGTQRDHPRFGPQIEVDAAEASTPSSVEGIRAYLASSLVKGIGPAMAERITAVFGADTLRVIEETPERLREVRGLGPRKIEELSAAVHAHRDVQQVMVFLRTHGLGQGLAARIVRQLGRNASALIEANPFRLADEVIGIGFKRADQLARQLGIAATAPTRVAAGIEYTLGRAARDGHCYLPLGELRSRAATLLDIDPIHIDPELQGLASKGRIVVEPVDDLAGRAEAAPAPDIDGTACYPTTLYHAEVGIARLLDRLLRSAAPPLPIDADRALAWFTATSRMQLEAGQYTAIQQALREPVSVITGGPGVGKTTIVRALVGILLAKGLRVLLAAPTGRAAKRLEESTGHGASTLHRALEYQPGRLDNFARDDTHPLDADMIVVDEASMIDVQLAYHLLRAIAPTTKLVFVGDIDQLPSVGPGRLLADVIDSQRVPVTRLTEIFRQAGDSDIVKSAHRVLQGEEPAYGGPGSDFYFVEARDSAHARKLIVEIVTQRVRDAFGLDPMRDVQVLCPMYRGDTGADTLNLDLQQALNPGPDVLRRGGHGLRPGDRVLQTRNDYDLDVFNGDCGRIESIDAVAGTVRVDFGDKLVDYQPSELDQLVPSYAISVHRSQGSEYPAVVIPITTDHFMMLRRNLLYTAITRGKRLVIVVGTRKALRMAIDDNRETRRYSRLEHRLRNA